MNRRTLPEFPYILCGPHNPMFLRNAGLIESTIKKMKLTPLASVPVKAKADKLVLNDEPFWWKYGGMILAHLHYQDQVYMLNNEQWKVFSKSLVETFRKQLDQASSISFPNAQIFANEMENLI